MCLATHVAVEGATSLREAPVKQAKCLEPPEFDEFLAMDIMFTNEATGIHLCGAHA